MMTDWSKVELRSFDLESYFHELVRGVEWEPLLNLLEIQVAKVRSTGTIYALCPFHSEKTPSCVFWPKSGRFLCHGCGRGGDKLGFALNWSGYDYRIEDFVLGATHEHIKDLQEILPKIESLFDACRQRQVDPNQFTLNFTPRLA